MRLFDSIDIPGAGDDPGWVVIDEFAGQWIALLPLARPTLPGLAAGFVLFRFLTCPEGAKVESPPGLWISLSRIEPVFTGLQFSNHKPPLIQALVPFALGPKAGSSLFPVPYGGTRSALFRHG